MHKSDVDIDLGIFDVQRIPKAPEDSTEISSSGPQEVAGGAVARRVQPNAKCSSCYHYLDQQVACSLGTHPMKCGIGDDAEHGYAPLVMSQSAVEAWKEKRDGVARPAQAHADWHDPKAEIKISIIGDIDGITLSEQNPFRKSEYRPPSSWLRFMARHIEKSDHPQVIAADIWWARLALLPPNFEKGLFQEAMTRVPSEAEIARSIARTEQPAGISKSEWRKTVIQSAHLELVKGDADTPLAGDSSETSILRSQKAKSFYASLKENTEKSKKQTAVSKAHEWQGNPGGDASAHALKEQTAAAHEKAAKVHTKLGNHDAAKQHLQMADKISQEMRAVSKRHRMGKSVDDTDLVKATNLWDYNSGPKSASLKGDELEGYLQGFLDAAAREEFFAMKAMSESSWWKNNGYKSTTSPGVNTWGAVEEVKQEVKGPPMYFPNHDTIAKAVWQKLLSKLPDNKNLLVAKRQFSLSQDGVKTRIKSTDYGC